MSFCWLFLGFSFCFLFTPAICADSSHNLWQPTYWLRQNRSKVKFIFGFKRLLSNWAIDLLLFPLRFSTLLPFNCSSAIAVVICWFAVFSENSTVESKSLNFMHKIWSSIKLLMIRFYVSVQTYFICNIFKSRKYTYYLINILTDFSFPIKICELFQNFAL